MGKKPPTPRPYTMALGADLRVELEEIIKRSRISTTMAGAIRRAVAREAQLLEYQRAATEGGRTLALVSVDPDGNYELITPMNMLA